jgi:hypothetical protein
LVWTDLAPPLGLRPIAFFLLQARPEFRPIDSKILANLLELGLFHDFPPARRKLQQFPPRAVWAAAAEWAMRGRPTLLAGRALFGRVHPAKDQKH